MNDDALEVLMEVYESIKPNLPKQLVEKCYRVEKTYQYEHDREVPLSDLRRLVTIAAEHESEGENN
jgi:hypothetical protein